MRAIRESIQANKKKAARLKVKERETKEIKEQEEIEVKRDLKTYQKKRY